MLEAAARLFAERGPDAVSVREVAAEAGINHALIHRHFGSKDELVALVVSDAIERVGRAAADGGTVADAVRVAAAATRREATGVRMIAWALLSGTPVERLADAHPAARTLIERLREAQARSGFAARTAVQQPEAAIGSIQAMLLGWIVFEPFLLRATGIDPDDVDDIIAASMELFLAEGGGA